MFDGLIVLTVGKTVLFTLTASKTWLGYELTLGFILPPNEAVIG